MPADVEVPYGNLVEACRTPGSTLSSQSANIDAVVDGLSQIQNLNNDQLNALYALQTATMPPGVCHALGWVSFVMFSGSSCSLEDCSPPQGSGGDGIPQSILDILNGFITDCEGSGSFDVETVQSDITTLVEFVQAGIDSNAIDTTLGTLLLGDLAAMQAAETGPGFCDAFQSLRTRIGL